MPDLELDGTSFTLHLSVAGVDRSVGDAAERGLLRGLEHVGQVSDDRAPIEYGDLIRSRRVTVDGDTGAVSYNTRYAVRQHEELDWEHNEGRQAKYLESALYEEMDAVQAIIADELRQAFR